MSRYASHRILAGVLTLFFVAAGVNHFRSIDFYASIVPRFLPYPYALVIISGVAEVVLGVLLLPHQTRRLAGWGLVALLVAVFPANISMAMQAENYPDYPPVLLWLRLPLQIVLIAVVVWVIPVAHSSRKI